MRKLITLFRCCVPRKKEDDYKENLEENRVTEESDTIMNIPEIIPYYKFEIDDQDQIKNNNPNSNYTANEESKKTEKEIVDASKFCEKVSN